MAVVTFVYADWSALYPELVASTSAPQALAYFNRACLILNNTDSSIVADITERTNLLYLLTAHLAALGQSKAVAAGLVGRITSASEGTVSLGVQGDLGGGMGAGYYQQTEYGWLYWLATASYRTARYVAPPQRVTNPFARLYGRGYTRGW